MLNFTIGKTIDRVPNSITMIETPGYFAAYSGLRCLPTLLSYTDYITSMIYNKLNGKPTVNYRSIQIPVYNVELPFLT